MAEVSIISDGTNQYTLRDSVARQMVESLENRTAYIGVTTTPLSTGSTTRYIIIDGETVEVTKGNIAIYQTSQFLWTGAQWQQFGDMSTLGALAYKDQAQATYIPEGSITNTDIDYTPQGEITLTPDKSNSYVSHVVSEGSDPSFTYDESEETLTFNAGSQPTFEELSVMTDMDVTATFTGTQETLQTQSVFQGTEATITSS